MIRAVLACLLYLIVGMPTLFAQVECGHDPLRSRLLAKLGEQARYEKTLRDIESILVRQALPNAQTQSSLYTIPVVIHVIHTGDTLGSTYNPSDDLIQSTLDYLSSVYDGSLPGLQGAGDIDISFVLAKRDPNCNPTNGINRINGSNLQGYAEKGVNVFNADGADELQIKNLSRWDPTRYYNIWIVNRIDGKDGSMGSYIGGFAYYPGAPAALDGTILLAREMAPGKKTLPHELGHALFLLHPFETVGMANCQSETNCNSQGDFICDTDPITQPAGGQCRTGNNTCIGQPYNANTESNFMNYTNCYTLFTPQQKNRMLASMSLPSRLSLANSTGSLPTTSPAVPCPPKINFNVAGQTIVESGNRRTDCKRYRDYVYALTIGNEPADTVRVVLNTLGSAVRGADFELYTQADLNSQNDTLVFPGGQSTAQSFTVRILDDLAAESPDSLRIQFNILSPSNNAVPGDGIPELILQLIDDDLPPQDGNTSVTVPVGISIANFNGAPFDGRFAQQRTQMLYSASELTAAGVQAGPLNSLAFFLQKQGVRPFSQLTVNLGSTQVSHLVDNFVLNAVTTSTVATLSSYSTTSGWNHLPFSQPFHWNGTDALVVEICYQNGLDQSDAPDLTALMQTPAGSQQGDMVFERGLGCNQPFVAPSFLSGGYKPILRLNYNLPATTIAVQAGRSFTGYLGPFANLYFYDSLSGELLGSIRNATSLDHGCTEMKIERSGIGVSPFWNLDTAHFIMSKIFSIRPERQGAAGQYEISLYYRADEMSIWQQITGQSLANINMIKADSSLTKINMLDPNSIGIISIVNPLVDSLGSNRIFRQTFQGMHASFGLGVPGRALPLNWLSFQAQWETDQEVGLSWKTAQEINTAHFIVERSSNGQQFNALGRVMARNNRTTVNEYKYRDITATDNRYYYRIRQVDQDGKYSFSKTLRVSRNEPKPTVELINTLIDQSIYLQTTLSDRTLVQAALLDVQGRTVWSDQKQGSPQLSFSIPTLTKGIYVLRIQAGDRLYQWRVLH